MKRLLVAFAFSLVACAPKPPPAPPGRTDHAVGLVTIDLEDTTRATPANGSAPGQPTRKLTTDVWYPAVGAPSDDPQDAAELDPSGKPYPLVVFVHGSGGFRAQSTFLMAALARHGYVVMAADFPLTSLMTAGGSSDQHVEDQLGDVSFLATQMAAMASDSRDPMFEAIDPSAGYAVSGHSTGGTVALAMAYGPTRHDARVKAALALAPCACFFGDSFFTTRSVPLLVLAGTDDKLVPPSTNGERAYDLAKAPKALGLLVGGSHLRFTDFNLDDPDGSTPTTPDDDLAKSFSAWGGGTACTPFPPIGTDAPMTLAEQHRLTVKLALAFFDQSLHGKTGALADAATGEAALDFQSK